MVAAVRSQNIRFTLVWRENTLTCLDHQHTESAAPIPHVESLVNVVVLFQFDAFTQQFSRPLAG